MEAKLRQYAESTIFSNQTGHDGKAIVVEVHSKSNPNRMYRVDLTNGRCSCPAWVFKKGERTPCKHLRDLGYVPMQSKDMQVIEKPVEENKQVQYEDNL